MILVALNGCTYDTTRQPSTSQYNTIHHNTTQYNTEQCTTQVQHAEAHQSTSHYNLRCPPAIIGADAGADVDAAGAGDGVVQRVT